MVSDAATQRYGRLGRTAAVLFFSAGIATLGLLTDGEHRDATAVPKRDPLRGFFPEAMPRYPDVNEAPMGTTRLGGGETSMSHFVTRHEPDRVANFYLRAWRRQGLWVRDDITHRGGVVSAVDAPNGRIYQVLIDARGDDGTHVFPSSNAMPRQLVDGERDRLPFSLYRGSQVLMELGTSGGPHGAHMIMSLNEGTLESNLAHYRSVLAASGYREDLGNDTLAGRVPSAQVQRVLVYRNPRGAEVTVNISRVDERRTRVHIMSVGG